jgi:hypothetical protein
MKESSFKSALPSPAQLKVGASVPSVDYAEHELSSRFNLGSSAGWECWAAAFCVRAEKPAKLQRKLERNEQKGIVLPGE